MIVYFNDRMINWSGGLSELQTKICAYPNSSRNIFESDSPACLLLANISRFLSIVKSSSTSVCLSNDQDICLKGLKRAWAEGRRRRGERRGEGGEQGRGRGGGGRGSFQVIHIDMTVSSVVNISINYCSCCVAAVHDPPPHLWPIKAFLLLSPLWLYLLVIINWPHAGPSSPPTRGSLHKWMPCISVLQ